MNSTSNVSSATTPKKREYKARRTTLTFSLPVDVEHKTEEESESVLPEVQETILNTKSENATQYRQCKCCGRVLPLTTEHFDQHKGCRGGYYPRCKECKQKRRKSLRDVQLTTLSDSVLLAELKSRGYTGALTQTLVKNIAL